MKLAVIGTGYVGLVAGAGFSDFGNDVTCVDIEEDRIQRLRRGESPIHEPGLPELLARNIRERRLSFTTHLKDAVHEAEVILIAVGTPPRPDGSADLSQVLAAARAIGQSLTGPAVVVTKSTVPVGTAEKVKEVLAETSAHPFAVASNPEFLKEGTAVEDFMRPMRVIIGVGPKGGGGPAGGLDDELARRILRRLYEPVVRTNDRLVFTDARSAEMTKYAANAYLAARVSFMNSLANLCERMGADVEQVRRGMGMDNRIGPKFLFPGIGFGGSCFPKDVQALISMGKEHGVPLPIVDATWTINQNQKLLFFEKLLTHLQADRKAREPLLGKTIAIWGLSFKPETDDVREAPALLLIERLLAAGASVRATDPVALENARRHVQNLPLQERATFYDDAYEAASSAHALVLCTEWRQYRQPNWKRLRGIMASAGSPGVFDGRNIWDGDQLRELGFVYHAVGRK